MPQFSRKTDSLYFKLNNRLEQEVGFIDSASARQLDKHYHLMAKLRIRISNREALSYLYIGIAAAILFGFTISSMVIKGYSSAGHIYSVMTYLWMFVSSLDDSPQLIEQFSKLKDIGKRVDI